MLREGPGALGDGVLCEGLIAERWLLNALAVVISKPKLVEGLFSVTGQESSSRYCVRVFEGSSWRNIFIDDRVPVSPVHLPLCCHTSSVVESWPMLLSKAIAKYLGSYGQTGRCAERGDCTEQALRWFTGGHVIKRATADMSWVTDETACKCFLFS